jgi:hypothetical protein
VLQRNKPLWAAYESKCSDEDQFSEREWGFESLYRYQMKDHCPRCLSPWETVGKDVQYCLSRCGMRKFCSGRTYKAETYICDNIINNHDFLAWYVDLKYCVYFKPPDFERTKLPYLKLDIETEKLKLYLTFS